MQINKYENVISLGFFCSTALELERIGLRQKSNPFDWVLSYNINNIIELINNNFKDLFNKDYFRQYKENSAYYMNDKYNIHFYHDFDKYRTLEEQLHYVEEKYKRRIERFYKDIKSKTLFIRYIYNQKECKYIENNFEHIVSILRKYNQENDIIFIANQDVKSNIIKIFNVEIDDGDTVARRFLEKNIELKNYLMSDIYDIKKRKNNIKIYKKKINSYRRKNFLLKFNIFKKKELNNLDEKKYSKLY